MIDQNMVRSAGRFLQETCYNNAFNCGWHSKNGVELTADEQKELFAKRIALCHSELSEALEGDRMSLQDDKLPHRKMSEVELADAIIRIFDLAGAMRFDLGGALAEKLAFNAVRPDHTIEHRRTEHGKKY